MTKSVVFVRDGATIRLTFPFDAAVKDRLKREYAARWDADGRVWVVQWFQRDDIVHLFESEGYEAFLQENGEVRRLSSPASPTHFTQLSWAQVLYDATPPELRHPMFKAVMKVVHPDSGGSTRMAQDLNEAFRRDAS
jgi:hypothetical protein